MASASQKKKSVFLVSLASHLNPRMKTLSGSLFLPLHPITALRRENECCFSHTVFLGVHLLTIAVQPCAMEMFESVRLSFNLERLPPDHASPMTASCVEAKAFNDSLPWAHRQHWLWF